MLRSLAILMLAGAAACGAQTTASPAPAAPTAPAAQQPAATNPPPAPKPAVSPETSNAEAALSPAQPVITIDGVCSITPAKKTNAAKPARTTASPACKTLITKAQFEKLLAAVSPGNAKIAPAMRRNLAQAYVELLTFNQAAEEAGVDKDPNFAEVMRLVRMRTLEDFYRRRLEEKYRNPPAAELQSYYDQNLKKYEEIKLSRIFIPAKNPSSTNKDDWEKKAEQEAKEIHDRAAKGEDFDKLQKEAYTTLGLTIAPPSTSAGTRRRGAFSPKDEQELFALKAGDVSKLEQEPAGFIIYKVESRETLPLDQVKAEISSTLYTEKMQAQLKSVMASVHADFNDQYFGPAAASGGDLPGRPPVPAGATQPGEKPTPKPAEPKPPGSPAPPSSTPSSTTPAPPSQTPPK